MIRKFKVEKSVLKKIPAKSGVYTFYGDDILYIGKAKNLKNRLANYFSKNLERKTQKMISSAKHFSIRIVNSEIEALLLEAKLINKYKPKYNIQLKDDKTPLYIGITNEDFPRVLTLRQTQLKTHKLKKVYGPFLNASTPRKVLKLFRRIVPYSSHKVGKRECVYSQIGLCEPCPTKSSSKEDQKLYLKNIRKLQSLLNGNIKKVKSELQKDLEKLSKQEDFESAQLILNKIKQIDFVLQKHIEPIEYLKNPNLIEDLRKKESTELRKIIENNNLKINNLSRIECYDVAHLAGSNPTASMVTFVNGEPEKKFYRHFKINQKNSQDDYASLREVLNRRKRHFKTWGKPDLIIIDGGKGQLSSSKKIISDIPMVGLAKREETLMFLSEDGNFSQKKLPRGNAKNLVQRLRNEAHRFARRLHHKLVTKELIHN